MNCGAGTGIWRSWYADRRQEQANCRRNADEKKTNRKYSYSRSCFIVWMRPENFRSRDRRNCAYSSENRDHRREQEAEAADGTQEIDLADMFSDRDRDATYDEAESAVIQLSDGGSSCGSDAVVISQNTVTITDEGTYILSGSLSDGMVVVDAEDTDKV